jgi:hypothetical protein
MEHQRKIQLIKQEASFKKNGRLSAASIAQGAKQ